MKASVDYTYDALGRRNSRKAEGVEINRTESEFTYDGFFFNMVKQRRHFADNWEDTLELDHYYLGSQVMGSKETRWHTSHEISYRQDSLGSVIGVEEQNVVRPLKYDAFGNSLLVWNNKEHYFGYNGKPQDSVTGLYNYGYRDYSSTMGRFTTVDPIRADNNWYRYVNNDPVNFIDPLGLDDEKANTEEAVEYGGVYVGYNDLDHYRIHGKNLGTVGEQVVHASIVIVDKDNNAIKYLESGPVTVDGINRNTKVSDSSYVETRFKRENLEVSNKDGEWQEQYDSGVYKREAPEGMTDDEYAKAIIKNSEEYNNSDPYNPVPLPFTENSNSNSYVGTMLRETYYEHLEENPPGPITAHAMANLVNRHTAPDVNGAIGWYTDLKEE